MKVLGGYRLLCAALLLTTTQIAFAQAPQPDAAKLAALDRYLQVVPMGRLFDETIEQVARQMPAERQTKFLTELRAVIDQKKLEDIVRASMLKFFTAEELNAMAEFYSSKHGASAMAKFPAHTGDIMPAISQEIRRGVQELRDRSAAGSRNGRGE